MQDTDEISALEHDDNDFILLGADSGCGDWMTLMDHTLKYFYAGLGKRVERRCFTRMGRQIAKDAIERY